MFTFTSISSLAYILTLSPLVLGQDLSTLLSICPNPQFSSVGTSPVYDGLSNQAQCSTSSTAASGYTTCPTKFYNAFVDSGSMYYQCGTSLATDCAGTTCPFGTQCLKTFDGASNEYYFCGVQCGGDANDAGALCDNAGAKYLSSNYVAYCDYDSDQCGTCSNVGSISYNSDTQNYDCSSSVNSFPPRGTFYQAARKRRRNQEVLKQKHEEGKFCPKGLSICAVDAEETEFECLDTESDVQNCGGCPLEHGVDCSALPGVTMGGVTCHKGLCIASRCEPDYTLINGNCLLTKSYIASKNGTISTRTTKSDKERNSRKRSVLRTQVTSKAQLKMKAWQTVEVVGEMVEAPVISR